MLGKPLHSLLTESFRFGLCPLARNLQRVRAGRYSGQRRDPDGFAGLWPRTVEYLAELLVGDAEGDEARASGGQEEHVLKGI